MVERPNKTIDLINSKIKEYENFLDDLLANPQPDKETITKYRHYIQCLVKFQHELVQADISSRHTIWEVLTQNHLKHDTEFIFIDGTNYFVSMDDECALQDNCVLLLDHDKFESEKVMFIRKVINCDNVLMVRTVEEK